jgi:hypothetical protein
MSKASDRRLGDRAKAIDLNPLISDDLNTLVVPDTFRKPDNYIGHYIMRLGKQLGYSIRLLPVDKESIVELSEHDHKIGLGMFMSLEDQKANFRFTKKTDPYEIGRTIVRAQQIIGSLQSINQVGADILKANNYYFGNLQSKTAVIKKDLSDQAAGPEAKKAKKGSTIHSPYWVKSAPSLFEERKWGSQLTKILVHLMRRSYSLVEPMVLWDNLVPYITSYSDLVRSYCTRSIVTVPSRGRHPAQTVDRVPGKPRTNNLLLKPELGLMDRVSASLWEPTPWESMDSDEWAQALLANSLDTIKSDLAKIYNARAAFLSKLAAVTTKRLQSIRNLSESMKSKRKSDVNPEILERMLLARSDMTETLVSEIISLDNTGDSFLKEWAAGRPYTNLISDKSSVIMDEIKRTLRLEITREGFYASLKDASAAQLEQIRAFQSKISEETRAREAWLRQLKNQYGESTIQKWKANLKEFNFQEKTHIEPLQRRSQAERKALLRGIPHESRKPQGSAAADSKGKKKREVRLPNAPQRHVKYSEYTLDTKQAWLEFAGKNQLDLTETTVLLCEVAARSGKLYPVWYSEFLQPESGIIGNDGVDLKAIKDIAYSIHLSEEGGVASLEA